MANSYATNTQIKALTPDTTWSTTYDTLLTTLAERASRALDRYLGREPGAFASSSDDSTRYFDGSGDSQLWIGELAAAPTSVSLSETGGVASSDYTLLSSTDYYLWPSNALLEGLPYNRIDLDVHNGSYSVFYRYPRAVKVIGQFGYATTTTTPPEVVQATCIQAMRWFKRGQQAFADAGAIQELGQLRLVQQLDPDVKALVDHLRRLTI